MNYFNYFTEIEDTFIRRRAKHLLLSPMDWALIESWKEMGVPLHVALRGIEQSFDSFEAKPRKRSVKTLLYCQEEVEAQFEEWRESQVGGGSETSDDLESRGETDAHFPFSREAIVLHTDRAIVGLEQILKERTATKDKDFCDTLRRVISRLWELKSDFESAARPSAERLEDSLTSLERLLDDALLAQLDAEELSVIHAEVEMPLKSYRSRMDVAMYKQTIDNMLLKRLREQSGVPRLSLFFL